MTKQAIWNSPWTHSKRRAKRWGRAIFVGHGRRVAGRKRARWLRRQAQARALNLA